MGLRERWTVRRRVTRGVDEFLRMPSISDARDESGEFRDCAECVGGSWRSRRRGSIMEPRDIRGLRGVGSGERRFSTTATTTCSHPSPDSGRANRSSRLSGTWPLRPSVADDKATCSPAYRRCVIYGRAGSLPSVSSASSRAKKRSAAPTWRASSAPTPISSPPTPASGRAP